LGDGGQFPRRWRKGAGSIRGIAAAAGHLTFDDGANPLDFLAPPGGVAVGDVLEIRDGEQIIAGHGGNGWINIGGCGKIHDDASTGGWGVLPGHFRGDDVVGGTGGAQDDLRAAHGLAEILHGDGSASHLGGQVVGLLHGPVDEHHGAHAGLGEQLQDFATHFPRADDQDRGVAQFGGLLANHPQRRGRHREVAPADACLTTDKSAKAHGPLEQCGEMVAGALCRLGRFQRAADLTEDFQLPHDERTDTTGRGKEVTARGVLSEDDSVLSQLLTTDPTGVGKGLENHPARGFRRPGQTIDLRPVAGGEADDLVDQATRGDTLKNSGNLRLTRCDAAKEIEGGTLVAEADDDQGHCGCRFRAAGGSHAAGPCHVKCKSRSIAAIGGDSQWIHGHFRGAGGLLGSREGLHVGRARGDYGLLFLDRRRFLPKLNSAFDGGGGSRSVTSRTIVFLLSTMALWVAVAAHAGDRHVDFDDLLYLEGVSWSVLDHDAGGLVFEVVNTSKGVPPPTISKLESHHWLAAPSGSRPTFEVLDLEWELVWERGEHEKSLGTESRTRGGGVPVDFTLPRGHSMGDFRGVGMISLRVGVATSMYAHAPSYENGMAVLRRGRFAVTFEGGRVDDPPEPADLHKRDPYLLEMAEALFLNPGQVPLVSRGIRPMSEGHAVGVWNRRLSESAERGPIALLEAAGDGWHEIDRAALESAGIPVSEWNPSRLAAFIGNEATPLLVETRDGAVSTVGLWVPRREKPGAAFVPVWLMESGPDSDPLRLGEPEAGHAIMTTGAPRTERMIFEPRRWSATYPALRDVSRWATETASPGGDLRVRFDAPGRVENSGARLTIWFGGNRDTFSAKSDVYLNGESLARGVEVMGNSPLEETFTLPEVLLREEGNLLVMTFDAGPHNVPQEELVLSKARVEYPSTERLLPNSRIQIAEADAAVEIVSHGSLLDITNPQQARWLGDDDELEPGRRVAAVDRGAPRSFANASAITHRNLLKPEEGADMIIVAAEVLREAAEEYAEYRRTDSRRVKLLTMEEIQRSYSFGWTTDGALRSALTQAFAAWPGQRPRQVLLIGEASEYWWQIDHPRDDVAPNLVPVQGYANPEVLIRGDDGHVTLGGSAGRIADMEIGRIPADTPEEVRQVLEMVRQYETNTPGGKWRDQHLIVTDDEEEFTRVAERVIVGSLFSRSEVRRHYLHEHSYEDYFRIFQRKRSIAATEGLIDELNEGALTATYIGHGGPNLWSPRRLLHMRDLPRISNGLRRPLLLAGSCDTAWLDFPVEPVRRSLAERFLLSEDGGAIAVFAPVAGAVPHEHDYLLRAYYDAMLDHQDWEVGRHSLASKINYLLYRQDPNVPGQYVLLGDPALRLANSNSGGMQINVETPALHAHGGATIDITGSMADWAEGEVEVWLEDRTGRKAIPPVSVPMDEMRFATGLNIDKSLAKGEYAVVARFVEQSGRVHRAQERLRIDDLPAEVAIDVIEVIEDGSQALMEVTASILAPAMRGEAQLVIRHRDAAGKRVLAEIPMTANEPATWSDKVSLGDGINVMIGEIIESREGGERSVLDRNARRIPRPTADLPQMDLLPQSAVATPNRAEEVTMITLHIINLTDERLDRVGAELLLVENGEERRLGSFGRGSSILPGSQLPMSYRARELLSPGTHRMRLRMMSGGEDNNGEDVVSVRDFEMNVPVPPRIEIVPGSISAQGERGFRGETVFVNAKLRNAGTTPVHKAMARLYRGWPSDGGQPAPSETGNHEVVLRDVLDPGEERAIRLRWDPRPGSPAEETLVVVAGTSDHLATEGEQAAMASVSVSQRELPNLALLRDEMRVSRELVRPGDVFSIQVPFMNDSGEDFDFPFLVEVRAEGPMVDDEVILQHEIDGLAAGERIDLPVSWRADGQRTRIHAVVNEEREFGERRGDDNDGHRDISYLLPEERLQGEEGTWTFAADRHLGTHANTMIDPGDAITIARRPGGGTVRTFNNDMVVGDPIPTHGPGTNTDGLMALADGALYWTVHETIEPVRLNVPLPDGRITDVVDVYLTQLGPAFRYFDQANGYQVRFGDGEWITNPNREEIEVYFGRVQGADGVLDMEIAPDGDPTWNTITQIRMVPVEGTYTSPMYEMERFRGGTFAPRLEVPEGATVRFEVRTSSQASLEPQFTQWGEIAPGLRLPPDSGIRMMQWRARLGAGPGGNPRVEDAVFEFAP